MYLTLYLVTLVALAVHAPETIWQPGSREFFIIIGVLGVWRYSWGTVHFVRSLVYAGAAFRGCGSRRCRWVRTPCPHRSTS
jgi:hypothetical protein